MTTAILEREETTHQVADESTVVRLDLMTGKLPPSVLESDVPLFDSFIEAMNHDLGTPES